MNYLFEKLISKWNRIIDSRTYTKNLYLIKIIFIIILHYLNKSHICTKYKSAVHRQTIFVHVIKKEFV